MDEQVASSMRALAAAGREDSKMPGSAYVHGALAVAGLVPGWGAAADLADAAIYAAEGDWTGAGVSAFNAIPLTQVAGLAAKGGRAASLASKAEKASEVGLTIAHAVSTEEDEDD